MITRYVKEKPRRETVYSVTCECGNVRWLSRSNAKKAGQCFLCSQHEKAVKGYKALVAKKGPLVAIETVQAYRLEHPSKLEQQMIGILHDLDVPYEREVLLLESEHHYLIDFVIAGVFAVEVQGGCHVNHIERDRYKANAIRNEGYKLLVIDAHDMWRARDLLLVFLNLSPCIPTTCEVQHANFA